MDNVELMIQRLEPEIDLKCTQIKQKKSERLLTKIFIAAVAIMLILPSILIFIGVSMTVLMVPILFIGAMFLGVSPILLAKGAEYNE